MAFESARPLLPGFALTSLGLAQSQWPPWAELRVLLDLQSLWFFLSFRTP